MALKSELRKWWALYAVCAGVLIIELDTTVVNVALPAIRQSLGFSDTKLIWVVNAYVLAFGGFMLLGGRLGDLWGHRRVLLWGLAAFTTASASCAFANSPASLIVSRAVQGVAGATVAAVALSLIVILFDDARDRAKAMGIYSFVCAGGGSLGAVLGGALTTAVNWRWVFLINVPIGVMVLLSSRHLLPESITDTSKPNLDLAGAATITLSLVLAVYSVMAGHEHGWPLMPTTFTLAIAIVSFAAFLAIEHRSANPLVPLHLFRLRNVATANLVCVLVAAATFGWFFLGALYLQGVLGYTALQVGLAFLPANVLMAAFALGLSARVVVRFGYRRPVIASLVIVAAGLALFARLPPDGSFWVDVLPAMILLGIGCGLAFNPLLLAAMTDMPPNESGLASGLVNTSFMLGGALGLAILASIAAQSTTDAGTGGTSNPTQLVVASYRTAFILAAVCSLLGALFATRIREGQKSDSATSAESASSIT